LSSKTALHAYQFPEAPPPPNFPPRLLLEDEDELVEDLSRRLGFFTGPYLINK
jgi:hypothetical protein